MKKTLSFLLALVLAAGLVLPASALEAEKVNTYTPGQFTDVPEGSWCAAGVQTAYEYGLMGGKSADRFDPSGLVTMAQAVAMACRVHALYCGDGPELPAGTGTPWYQPYADYAVAHQFLGFEGYTERDFNSPILRCDFAGALWAALPEEALSVISSVEDGGIPDVSPQAYYGEPVYALYPHRQRRQGHLRPRRPDHPGRGGGHCRPGRGPQPPQVPDAEGRALRAGAPEPAGQPEEPAAEGRRRGDGPGL